LFVSDDEKDGGEKSGEDKNNTGEFIFNYSARRLIGSLLASMNVIIIITE
jgi:hypothetical protein